eukprot:scaffold4312_cov105-Alexandrium_tamarense.AAC.1
MNYPSRRRISIAALSLWIGLRLLLNEVRFINENSSIADTEDGMWAPSAPSTSTKTHSHQQQHERDRL